MTCSTERLQALWNQARYHSESAEALCECFRPEIRRAAQQVVSGSGAATIEQEVCQGLLWNLVQLNSRR